MGVGWEKYEGYRREQGKDSSLGNECWIWKMPEVPGDSAFLVQHLNSSGVSAQAAAAPSTHSLNCLLSSLCPV